MTTIRRIPTSKIDGNSSNSTTADEIRPYGEIAVYVNTDDDQDNKLELLIFDGERTHLKSKVLSKGTFYGGDADSGDGEGLDTIKLIPDAELYRDDSDYDNDQYIIIDPTGGEPNHIHIRAGGTIDQSRTDLFLGGENNNVRVSDINDRVTINTDAGEGLRNWIFDNSGNLTLPAGGDIRDSEGNSVLGGADTGNWTFDSNTLSEGGAGDAVIEASDYAGAKLILQTRGLSNKQWAFDQDGALTFPDNTVQTTAYTGGGADTGDITFENNTIIAAADTNFYIESKDDTDVVRAYIRLDPGNGLAEMRALSSYRSALFSSGGWTTAEWTGTGGTGQLAFTGATELQDFLDNSLGGSVNITFSINNGEFIAYDGRDGSGGDVNFSTSISPPADPTTVTDIEFRYYRESRIQIDSDDDEITIYGDGLDINLNSTASIDISAPQVTVIGSQYAQLQSGNNYMSVEGTEGAFISISTGEGNNTFAFEHVSGTTRLKLPAGGDIVDNDGNSVLGGAANEITNTDGEAQPSTYSVSVGTDGVVTMTTSRGVLEFGALPEPGAQSHFHIMRAAGENADLYFGDDFNYVLQRGPAYNGSPAYGVEIGANDNNSGDQQVWRFGTDGDLTLPAGGDILDSNGASVLGGSSGGDFTTNVDGSKTLTIESETTTTQTVYAYNYPNSGASFVLKAPGNQFRITGSNSGVNVSVFANGSTVTFTSYTLLLTSDIVWDGTNWNADCTVTSGGSVSEDIILYGYMMGSVVVTSTTSSEHEYTFGGDGSLTFPDGTVQTTAPESFSFSVAADDSTQRAISNNELVKFIGAGGVTTSSDAEGNITITGNKVVGEWAVQTGTSTYTFTLPSDGTYVMWVKGNIPNGIITWNATASVSNSNVPAIGTQYAWNYTGGGSPISLTSIPDQIRGVAGTISTDATYLGTTSNRFDFGISNTSGSTQTIYYGYTKIS